MGIGIAHRKIGEALNELGNYESALKHHQKYLGNSCKIQMKSQRVMTIL